MALLERVPDTKRAGDSASSADWKQVCARAELSKHVSWSEQAWIHDTETAQNADKL